MQKEVKLKVLKLTTPVDKEFFCVHAKVNPTTTTDCGMAWYSAENVMRRRGLIALLADSR